MTSGRQVHQGSSIVCVACERRLSIREVDEYRSLVDGTLCGEAYCRTCLEAHVALCRECSCRRTADPCGMCEECTVHVYALAG